MITASIDAYSYEHIVASIFEYACDSPAIDILPLKAVCKAWADKINTRVFQMLSITGTEEGKVVTKYRASLRVGYGDDDVLYLPPMEDPLGGALLPLHPALRVAVQYARVLDLDGRFDGNFERQLAAQRTELLFALRISPDPFHTFLNTRFNALNLVITLDDLLEPRCPPPGTLDRDRFPNIRRHLVIHTNTQEFYKIARFCNEHMSAFGHVMIFGKHSPRLTPDADADLEHIYDQSVRFTGHIRDIS